MEKIKLRMPIPEHAQALICQEYADGESQNNIAKSWEVSIRQVRNILYNHNLGSHPENGCYLQDDSCLKGSNDDANEQTDDNVLIIPDLHAPFVRDGYLEFCKKMYKKWKCTQVYFLGDLIDNHYSSFHDTDPDGLSATDELDKAIEQLDEFHEAFPVARVVFGNHDNIPNRKAFNAGISTHWVKRIDEVLNFPGWFFNDVWWHRDIMICHGLGRVAHNRMKQDMVSVIQGHYHSKSYIQYQVGTDRKTFAMQLGCGMDNNNYAAAYGKWFSRPHINIGILINGEIPLIEYMEL